MQHHSNILEIICIRICSSNSNSTISNSTINSSSNCNFSSSHRISTPISCQQCQQREEADLCTEI